MPRSSRTGISVDREWGYPALECCDGLESGRFNGLGAEGEPSLLG